MFSPKFLDRAFVLRFPPATLPKGLDRSPFEGTASEALWPVTLDKAIGLASHKGLRGDLNRAWEAFAQWQSQYLGPLGVHFGHRFYASFRRYAAIGLGLGMSEHAALAEGDLSRPRFPLEYGLGPDERAVERTEATKREASQEWIERDTFLQTSKLLKHSLEEMIQRSRGRGMIELRDEDSGPRGSLPSISAT